MNVPEDRGRYYNDIAGGSRDRLAAISDGIFAVSMTLLVLGLVVPTVKEHELPSALAGLLPHVVSYVLSFMTLGIFWVGQQTQLSRIERSDRDYTWIMLAFLLFVTLVPFSTQLLAAYYQSRLALVEYWLNILVLGSILLAGAEYAARAGLFAEQAKRAILSAVRRRVYGAQILYLVAVALCVIDTRLSIGLIVLIQLNYAIAPRVPLLRRL